MSWSETSTLFDKIPIVADISPASKRSKVLLFEIDFVIESSQTRIHRTFVRGWGTHPDHDMHRHIFLNTVKELEGIGLKVTTDSDDRWMNVSGEDFENQRVFIYGGSLIKTTNGKGILEMGSEKILQWESDYYPSSGNIKERIKNVLKTEGIDVS